MRKPTLLIAAALLAALTLTTACETTSDNAFASDGPVIDRPGEYVMRYRDAELEVLVGHRFASGNLGADWLILNVAFSGRVAQSVEIDRRKIRVTTPDGRRAVLPEHKEFTRAYGEIQSASRRAALASDPLDFTQAGRRPYDLSFQPLPGTGVALESVHVTKRSIYSGLLYFPIPGGVQPGKWKFEVLLEEGEASLPFVLESEPAAPPRR